MDTYLKELERENERLKFALRVPDVWSDFERNGMAEAYRIAHEKHGHYESLFAVAAWLLRHRASQVS